MIDHSIAESTHAQIGDYDFTRLLHSNGDIQYVMHYDAGRCGPCEELACYVNGRTQHWARIDWESIHNISPAVRSKP